MKAGLVPEVRAKLPPVFFGALHILQGRTVIDRFINSIVGGEDAVHAGHFQDLGRVLCKAAEADLAVFTL